MSVSGLLSRTSFRNARCASRLASFYMVLRWDYGSGRSRAYGIRAGTQVPRARHWDALVALAKTAALSYNGGGLHLPLTTRHVAMPQGPLPAPNGDPATGVSAPLFALIA